MTSGSTIRKLRKHYGMTQGDLAREIARCKASVSMYERDLRDIPASVLGQIALTLHVHPGALFVTHPGAGSAAEEPEDAAFFY